MNKQHSATATTIAPINSTSTSSIAPSLSVAGTTTSQAQALTTSSSGSVAVPTNPDPNNISSPSTELSLSQAIVKNQPDSPQKIAINTPIVTTLNNCSNTNPSSSVATEQSCSVDSLVDACNHGDIKNVRQFLEDKHVTSDDKSELLPENNEASKEINHLEGDATEENKDEGEVHTDDDDLEEGELKDDDDGSTDLTFNHYQSNQYKPNQEHHQYPNKQPSYHSTSPTSSASALLPTPRLPPRNTQPIQKSSICRYFSSNACTWGDSCRFLHIAGPLDSGSEFADSIRASGNSRGPPPLPANQPPFHERDHHHMRHYSYQTSASSSYHDLHQSPQSPLPTHATSGYPSYRRHHNTTPPPIQSAAISPSANLRGPNRGPPPPPQSASSSLSSVPRPYPSSSSSADYERRRRLAFEMEPGNDRREVIPPLARDYPRAPLVSGPHYRDVHLREPYNHREPMPRREYQGYPPPNQSSHRSSMSWNRVPPGSNHRGIPSDARRPHSLKRHYQNEDIDESSWSDEGSSDDSLIGGASSDNSAARSNRSVTNMGGSGTPTGEPIIDDERRVQLLQQLEEVEEAIARKKKAKHEPGEQEQSQ